MKALKTDNSKNPQIIKTGMNVSKVRTPNLDAIRPVKNTCDLQGIPGFYDLDCPDTARHIPDGDRLPSALVWRCVRNPAAASLPGEGRPY